MTPRQVGEMLGFVVGEMLVLGIIWFMIVLASVAVAKLLRRQLTLRRAASNRWTLGVVAVLFVVLTLSRLGAP